MPEEVRHEKHERETTREIWLEVTDLFIDCFTTAPYFEETEELRTILDWGPSYLADASGVLVLARRGDQLVGFALAHGLSDDQPWQSILEQLPANAEPAAAALSNPEDALVLHELAVLETERGRGIAGACLSKLLSNRPELHTFVGVYERATEAAAMYHRWQVREIGQVPMPGGAVALHVLTVPTAELAYRLHRP